MSRKGTTPSSPAFVMSWLLLLMIAVSFPGWSLQGVTGWMVFAGTISLATIGAVLLVRSLWRAKTWGPVTRSLLVLSVSLVTLLSVGSAVVSWSFPQWCFDFQQRIKYPAYYAWRDGKAEFPARQFWIGFNTDRHKKEYFVGKSRQQIREHLPLVSAIPEDGMPFEEYAHSKKLPPERFAWIEGSLWLLEFDEGDICVDVRMVKG